MISKTGGRYWSTGITVTWSSRAHTINGVPHSGWSALLDFYDAGFVSDRAEHGEASTQGTLRTRYYIRDSENVSGLTVAVDNLITDAERLGIDFRLWDGRSPLLYYKGDGEDPEFVPPPNWRETLRTEADRLGWCTYDTV
ncbi:hypothetical protein F7R91_14820 [Streptomyces luteolifulvus]|uniref:Uncharacterized protein n=1 Tax=Streptomyces luteolifulvus TaxID=2615112 RepID=A0A6H9V3D7_9ACTN|nr:hypothetical protein [Streptomyces luteolifulvus]KAB1146846.1 hypothetical protein F7R91_14820 [Streptomyces luteolifulvus]